MATRRRTDLSARINRVWLTEGNDNARKMKKAPRSADWAARSRLAHRYALVAAVMILFADLQTDPGIVALNGAPRHERCEKSVRTAIRSAIIRSARADAIWGAQAA